MNVLVDDAIVFLIERGWQEIVPLLIFAILRPIGLTYGFFVFLWGFGNARLVRIAFAVSIGTPIILGDFERISTLIVEQPFIVLAGYAVVELVIGLSMGFIASLPFYAVEFAGSITDQFRGESDSGIHAPTGGTVSTFGLLYTVVAILVFVTLGGFDLVVGALFRSYTVWPLAVALPGFSAETLAFVLSVFADSLFLMIRVALPLLIFLLVIEISTGIAARIAQRYNFYNLAFPLKNLAAVAALPIVVYYIWLLENDAMQSLFAAFDLTRVFQP